MVIRSRSEGESDTGMQAIVYQGAARCYSQEFDTVVVSLNNTEDHRLTEGCTLGELTCMEEMISKMTEGKMIGTRVIQSLWDLFVMKNHESKADSTSSLVVISMIAAADAASVSGRLNTLVSVGLGPRCKVFQHVTSIIIEHMIDIYVLKD